MHALQVRIILIIPLIQSFRLDLATEQISIKEIWHLSETIGGMNMRWHREDLIELLEGLSFRFLSHISTIAR